MSSHGWCWSDLVNPELLEQALAAEEKRARRRLRKANRDPATDKKEDERRPVAA